MASSEEVRSNILAGVMRLNEALSAYMTARSEATDINVMLNTTNRAVEETLRAHLAAISEARNGLVTAEAALVGTANANASSAIQWVRQALEVAEDNVKKLHGSKEHLNQEATKVRGIRTDIDEGILRIQGAITELTAHANRV